MFFQYSNEGLPLAAIIASFSYSPFKACLDDVGFFLVVVSVVARDRFAKAFHKDLVSFVGASLSFGLQVISIKPRTATRAQKDLIAPPRTSRISGKLGQKWKVESFSHFGICDASALIYARRSRAVWLVDMKRSLKISVADFGLWSLVFGLWFWFSSIASSFSWGVEVA